MEVFRRYPLNSLSYHFPLPPRPFLDDLSKCKYFDLTLEEGLEIGKGNFPHSLVIPSICSKLKKDVIGTYEIKYGHKDPESMLRSDQFYRKAFGQNFNEYFQ